jgi:ABC-type polysaccharide/polyol phosphate export permease
MVMREKSSKAYFRNFISPIKEVYFITSIIITTLLLSLVHVFLIIALGKFLFGVSIINLVLTSFVIIFFAIIIFSTIGIIIAALSKTNEVSVMVTIFTSILLFLFSGTVVPLESMSKTMAFLARMNPFVLSENLLRKVMIFRKPISDLGFELWWIIIEVIIFLLLALFFYANTKNKI